MNAQLNAHATEYILNAIDSDGYDNETPTNTPAEKLAFLDKTFRSEYGFLIARIGYQAAMKEWISGLPSCFNIAFYNSDIIKIAVEWGSLPSDYTEAQADKIINNWFNFIAAKTTMLINKTINK